MLAVVKSAPETSYAVCRSCPRGLSQCLPDSSSPAVPGISRPYGDTAARSADCRPVVRGDRSRCCSALPLGPPGQMPDVSEAASAAPSSSKTYRQPMRRRCLPLPQSAGEPFSNELMSLSKTVASRVTSHAGRTSGSLDHVVQARHRGVSGMTAALAAMPVQAAMSGAAARRARRPGELGAGCGEADLDALGFACPALLPGLGGAGGEARLRSWGRTGLTGPRHVAAAATPRRDRWPCRP